MVNSHHPGALVVATIAMVVSEFSPRPQKWGERTARNSAVISQSPLTELATPAKDLAPEGPTVAK